MFGNKIKAQLTTVALSAAAMGFLTGCDLEEEQTVYCVDADNNVVDEDYCDDGPSHGGGFFFLYGSFGQSYHAGDRITGNNHTRINPSDSAARAKAGLPSTGKVSSGARVSGGIGSGKPGGSGGGSRVGGTGG